MKKLLMSLGATLMVGAPTAVLSNTIIENNSTKFDPINKFFISSEMQEQVKIMDRIISNPSSIEDIYDVVDILLQSTLMLDEVFEDNFFYELSTKISQVANLFRNDLEKIEYENSNFYSVIMKQTQEISVNYIIKMDPEYRDLFVEYEYWKRKEARLFFEIYDQKISRLTNNLQKFQKEINDLNIRNAKIGVKLEGLAKENEIINRILDVLDQNLKFIDSVKSIFDNAKSNITVYYDSSKWHAENWGLAFIPFYGTGFSINFQKNMDRTVRGMDTYVKTFLDENSPDKKMFDEMAKNLESMRDDIMAIDPVNANIISDLLQNAGLGEDVSNGLSKGLNEVIDTSLSAFPVVGQIVGALRSFLGVGFQAKQLANEFNNELKPRYETIMVPIDKNEEFINTSKNVVLNSKIEFAKQYKSNNMEQEKLRIELEKNTSKVAQINKDIEKVTSNINSINKDLTDTLSKSIFSDSNYYWYSNMIGDINHKNSKSLIDNNKTLIKEYNKNKNKAYNNLINKLNTSNTSYSIEEMITLIEYKNKYSDDAFEFIYNI